MPLGICQETELDTSALDLCGWCYFIGHSRNTRERKTVASLHASVEVCLEVNAVKTNYIYSCIDRMYHKIIHTDFRMHIQLRLIDSYFGEIQLIVTTYSKSKKRIIRIITNSNKNTSCRELFKIFNILPLQSQYTYSILLFITKNKDQFFPQLTYTYN
jgi:hypothetical protein